MNSISKNDSKTKSKLFQQLKTTHLYFSKKCKKNNELKVKIYWEILKKYQIEEYYISTKLTSNPDNFDDRITIIYDIMYIPKELNRKKKLLSHIKILFEVDINIIYKYKYVICSGNLNELTNISQLLTWMFNVNKYSYYFLLNSFILPIKTFKICKEPCPKKEDINIFKNHIAEIITNYMEYFIFL